MERIDREDVGHWLEQYRAGDVQALEVLIEQYKRPLFAFILRMVNRHDEAEEIFQEVWFKAIRNLDRFKGTNLLSWLFRITHNLVIDRSRRKKPSCSMDDPIGESGSLHDLVEDRQVGPDQLAAGHDLGTRIRQAVGELPEDQREVFLLRTEGQVPFKEIADIQGVSINTALARMQYALTKLREELKDDFYT